MPQPIVASLLSNVSRIDQYPLRLLLLDILDWHNRILSCVCKLETEPLDREIRNRCARLEQPRCIVFAACHLSVVATSCKCIPKQACLSISLVCEELARNMRLGIVLTNQGSM